MANQRGSRDVVSMQVQAQPSTGHSPSDHRVVSFRDGLRGQNLMVAQMPSQPAYQPRFAPLEGCPPRTQSNTPPYKLKGREAKFVNYQLPSKQSPRPRNAPTSPSRDNVRVESDPPPKRRRLTNPRPIKPILTTRRPLKNSDEVHRDVWRDILSYCDPRFLLEAKTVDRLMYDILSTTTNIWRRSRERHIPEAPICPRRLTEQEYIDLLVGKGCQVPHCLKTGVTAVAWPFLGRLCLDCIHEKTLKPDDLPIERQHMVGDQRLALALPMGRSKGGRYIKCPRLNADGDYQERRGNLALRSEWETLEAEYFEIVAQEGNEEALRRWYETKRCETKHHMLEIEAIDRVSISQSLRNGPTDGRKIANSAARKQLFIEEAAKLDPPITENTLNYMSAYHRALSTGNPPSTRAWETLKTKILPYRDLAEELARIGRQCTPRYPDADEKYRRLVDYRVQRRRQPKVFLPEQAFVIQLGEEELEKCLRDGVADSDLLLLTLKNVFDRYNELPDAVRPIGFNYNCTEGRYMLSFDDAVMIIQEVLEVALGRDTGRSKAVFKSLRCIACAKNAYVRDFDFKSAMEHVYKYHSSKVGEGEEYWRYAQSFVPNDFSTGYAYSRFPFYSTPWSRCLPLIPNHRDPRSLQIWHPDNDWQYVHMDTSRARSAFGGRCARACDAANNGFLEAVKYALGAMQGVRLSNQAVTKVAFQYALELGERHPSRPCTLEEFMAVLPALQEANPALNFKFMCGICLSDEAASIPGVHMKHPIAMKPLCTHWQKRHSRADLDWKRLLHLPSNSQLLKEMVESDKQLQEAKDEVMAYAAQEERSPKKRPNPKANAILGTRLAMTAFDQLFPKVMEARREVRFAAT